MRNVTNMGAMFMGAAAFNGDLSGWDVRNVTDMRRHVSGRRGLQRRPERLGRAQRHEHARHVLGAAAFNGDLSGWDVRNVTDMSHMFRGAAAFNGDLSGWDVRNVTDMWAMFMDAAAFNGDLSGWDVRNVTDMRAMFRGAAAFNGDLSGWDVRNVTDMCGMFRRRGLQRRPERLGRAQRHGHGNMFLNTPALNPKPAWYTGSG